MLLWRELIRRALIIANIVLSIVLGLLITLPLLGAELNRIAIRSNGGRMPVLTKNCQDEFGLKMATEIEFEVYPAHQCKTWREAKYPWLCDWIDRPDAVYSPGDYLIEIRDWGIRNK